MPEAGWIILVGSPGRLQFARPGVTTRALALMGRKKEFIPPIFRIARRSNRKSGRIKLGAQLAIERDDKDPVVTHGRKIRHHVEVAIA